MEDVHAKLCETPYCRRSGVVSWASFDRRPSYSTQRCFKLDPFNDILKLTFDVARFGHQNVYGIWIGPGFYTLPVSGAFELDSGSTTKRRLGIVGTNPGAFAGNLICGLDGVPGAGF